MGLLSMQKALSEFVNLKFLKNRQGGDLLGEVPVGTRLYWSKPILEKAIETVSQLSVSQRRITQLSSKHSGNFSGDSKNCDR